MRHSDVVKHESSHPGQERKEGTLRAPTSQDGPGKWLEEGVLDRIQLTDTGEVPLKTLPLSLRDVPRECL